MTPRPTILVPLDFSNSSRLALEQGSILARSMQAKMLIVHVEPGHPATWMGPAYFGLSDPGIAERAAHLGEAKPTEPGVEFEHRMLVGDPATEILRVAADESANMIVLGSHGHGGVRALLMGDVAEKVLRNATCAVIICREATLSTCPVPSTP